MKLDPPLSQVEIDQGGRRQFHQQALAGATLHSPQFGHHVDRNGLVFREHRQLLVQLPLPRLQPLQAGVERPPHRRVAIAFRFPVPAGDAFLSQVLPHGRHHLVDRGAHRHPFRHAAGDELEEQRPFPQAPGQLPPGPQFRRLLWQPGSQQLHRLLAAHGVYRCEFGLGLGDHRHQAAGDQAAAALPPAQERPQLGRIPHVIDHDQAVLPLQLLGQAGGGVFRILKSLQKNHLAGQVFPSREVISC